MDLEEFFRLIFNSVKHSTHLLFAHGDGPMMARLHGLGTGHLNVSYKVQNGCPVSIDV